VPLRRASVPARLKKVVRGRTTYEEWPSRSAHRNNMDGVVGWARPTVFPIRATALIRRFRTGHGPRVTGHRGSSADHADGRRLPEDVETAHLRPASNRIIPRFKTWPRRRFVSRR